MESLTTRTTQVKAELLENWEGYQQTVENYAKDGLKAPMCFHGVDNWGDYFDCYKCEEGLIPGYMEDQELTDWAESIAARELEQERKASKVEGLKSFLNPDMISELDNSGIIALVKVMGKIAEEI